MIIQEGLVSWYGEQFHLRPTASGELFDATALTMAHPTLPFGTRVKVTNLRNGRSVVVRVNDRGPFVAGRIIDLSYGAARRLGSAEAGVVPVLIEAALPAGAFAPPPLRAAPGAPPPLRGVFAVQVGAFSVEENALRLRDRLGREARLAPYDDNRGRWWRVRVGRFPGEQEAREAAARFEASGLPASFVVRED